ncbi:unnamed protein product, partial [Adineta steineri]
SFDIVAPASFAQIHILLGKQTHSDTNILQLVNYNMLFVYCLHSEHTLLVNKLWPALQLVMAKHQSLQTSLIFDIEKNRFMQQVISLNDNNDKQFIYIESTYESEEQLNDIMRNENCNTELFDLAQGLVFRCHIIYYKQISSNNILSDKDVIIFNFHHAIFDLSSMNIFLHDLNQAYTAGQLLFNDDNTTLRYLDYAVIEQEMSMTGASIFWLDALHDCKLDQSLSLPYDRYRLMNEHRTGHTTTVSFDFGLDLSHHFLTHASSHNIKHEHVALAIYYAYLFKLTNGEKDLCIAMDIDNRYRDELKSIIGLFENVIPVRCQLDSHWSFQYLLDYAREITTNSVKYSYFPLQRILNQHPDVSKPAFLDISFQFLSSITRSDSKLIMIGDSQLSFIPFTMNINDNETRNKYDFSLLIKHDLNINQFSCTINASLDLFNVETIDKISQRFHSILNQLFISIDDQMNKSIYEISLTSPDERLLIQSMNNTQVSFPSITCIHHEFVYQVMKHPQKLAVELDEQSLTYCELLYDVQVLSLALLNQYFITPGEIVCQCVERSLSMVIGIMGIEMAGGVYCPLSPRDPQHRLHALTQHTQRRLVLVHHLTKTKFDHDFVLLDIDSVLRGHVTECVIEVTRLSKVTTVLDDVAYIIFTSGSTGKPKAVQVRHTNFTEFMYSLVYGDVMNATDTILQIARCSYDAHVQDIIGTLMIGSSLIMLHPKGIMNFDYLASVFNEKNITCFTTVPTIIHNFFIYLQQQTHHNVTQYLRSVCSADQFSQSMSTNQEAELFVGGVGVFAGYLGRDDLTAKALVEIDGQLFYRTGDLVRIGSEGLIYYIGRNDYQVKLHGQRIELGE